MEDGFEISAPVHVFHNVHSPIMGSEEEADIFQDLKRDNISREFLFSLQDNLDEEESMDTKFNIVSPPQERFGPPARGDFPGPYNFNAFIPNNGSDKRLFCYSSELNRVYLSMLAELPINFQWTWPRGENCEFWIRATIVLAGTEQQESRVMRCLNHQAPSDGSNKDVPPHILKHILRSARQTDDIFYCGKEEDNQNWLSVCFLSKRPLPTGTDYLTHVYKFCCKHSCSSGINRRKIEVIFTLEDALGEIYGRKSIGVRVCSCPRRDMEKDLAEFKDRVRSGNSTRKRPRIVSSRQGPVLVSPPPPLSTVAVDNSMIDFNLKICGRANWELVHTTTYNAMTAALHNIPIGHPSRRPYEEVIRDLIQMKQNMLEDS